jgi:hypothetical protein
MKRKTLLVLILSAILLAPASSMVMVGGGETISQDSPEDLILIGGGFEHTGTVKGNLVLIGGGSRKIGKVEGDLVAIGGGYDIEADVGRNLVMIGGGNEFDGTVERDAKIIGGGVRLIEGTTIIGDLAISGGGVENNAQVVGDTYTGPEAVSMTRRSPFGSIPQALQYFFYTTSVLVNLLILFVASRMVPDIFLKTAKRMHKNLFVEFLRGFFYIVIISLVLVSMAVTLVLLPVAVALGMIFGILYWLSKYMTFSVLSDWLASSLGRKPSKKQPFLKLAFGYMIFELLKMVPYVGVLLSSIVVIAGFGSLFDVMVRGKG